MKRVLTPLAALAFTFCTWSLHASGWFGPAPERPDVHQSDNPYESEAAYRHRTCQPRHWRGMMLRN